MTEEEIAQLKAEKDALVEELAQSNQAKANLVSEVKDLREKKQLTESEKEQLAKKVKELEDLKNIDPSELNAHTVEEIISRKLNETLSSQNKANVEKNQRIALDKFKKLHPEFQDANDEGGIKFNILEKELATFNVGNAQTVEDFESIFEKARLLVTKEDSNKKQIIAPYSHTPQTESKTVPTVDETEKLSPAEQRMVDNSFAGDVSKYLAVKAKRPDYIETLLRYAR